MIAGGAILIVLGIGALSYGLHLNNSVEAQLSAFFSSGTVDPGTPWVIGGVIGLIVGAILLIVGLAKKPAQWSAAPGMMPASGANRCPYCGVPLERDAAFCGVCGRPVNAAAAANLLPPKVCPFCGAPLEDDAAFCGVCGRPVNTAAAAAKPLPPKVCPFCRAPLEDDAAFCSTCGRPLGAAGTSMGTFVPSPAAAPRTEPAAAPAPRPEPAMTPAPAKTPEDPQKRGEGFSPAGDL